MIAYARIWGLAFMSGAKVLALALGLLLPRAVFADTPPPARHPLTAADLDTFLDGFMPLALERGDIAGSVIVVVKDGRVLFEKGYGVSDVDKRTPIDPHTTMFRPASISKLFTWTAVMQLYEQHKLDLDTDINTYLDFKIPPAFGEPITLRNLMTHTAGFEDSDKSPRAADPTKLMTLEAAVKSFEPARVYPPGEVPAYSNYGAALAGYIVQRVSGEPFELYVAHHILVPLGMTHSTFIQPLPKAFAADMSKGYAIASGRPQPFELVRMTPSAGLSASGDDIAHFMIAHLNNGSYDGARILKPETAIMMHSIAYQHTPGISPMAWGFWHVDRNGHTVIGHGGDTLWFHSNLHLILDQNVGLFVSSNSIGKPNTDIRDPLFKSFMDRYFPAPPRAAEPTLASAKADGALVAGNYIDSRGSFTNILTITGLSAQSEARVDDDGTISVDTLKNFAGEPKKFHEIRPLVWREVHGNTLLVAKTGDGEVTELDMDSMPQILELRRAAWWQSAKINLPLFHSMLAVLALTVLFWPIKAVLRWRYGEPFGLSGREAMLYRLTRVVALCDLVLFCGVLEFFDYAESGHLELMTPAYDWVLRIIQIIGLAGTIGVVVPLLNVVAGFGNAARPWWTKSTDVLIAQACVLSVWFAFSQHLLIWSLNY
jgi:CubicO group peptidase (beta-lactamase class C family)